MAYAASGLVKLSNEGPGKISLWCYSTADSLATVAGAGYFNSAAAHFNVGDHIAVTAGVGGTMAAKWYLVSANSGTAVTIIKHDVT